MALRRAIGKLEDLQGRGRKKHARSRRLPSFRCYPPFVAGRRISHSHAQLATVALATERCSTKKQENCKSRHRVGPLIAGCPQQVEPRSCAPQHSRELGAHDYPLIFCSQIGCEHRRRLDAESTILQCRFTCWLLSRLAPLSSNASIAVSGGVLI